MEYLTTVEITKKWGLSRCQVAIFCKKGSVDGAIFKGNFWLILAEAKKPENPRRIRKKPIN